MLPCPAQMGSHRPGPDRNMHGAAGGVRDHYLRLATGEQLEAGTFSPATSSARRDSTWTEGELRFAIGRVAPTLASDIVSRRPS